MRKKGWAFLFISTCQAGKFLSSVAATVERNFVRGRYGLEEMRVFSLVVLFSISAHANEDIRCRWGAKGQKGAQQWPLRVRWVKKKKKKMEGVSRRGLIECLCGALTASHWDNICRRRGLHHTLKRTKRRCANDARWFTLPERRLRKESLSESLWETL